MDAPDAETNEYLIDKQCHNRESQLLIGYNSKDKDQFDLFIWMTSNVCSLNWSTEKNETGKYWQIKILDISVWLNVHKMGHYF